MAEFNYTRYADDLKKAAEIYDKEHPDFPDVAATYRKSAEVIEKLWKMYLSSETDATNLTGELVTVCAALDYEKRKRKRDAVKHGRWDWRETGKEDYEMYWVCSLCGDKTYYETNYCPNCGAKMDLEVGND